MQLVWKEMYVASMLFRLFFSISQIPILFYISCLFLLHLFFHLLFCTCYIQNILFKDKIFCSILFHQSITFINKFHIHVFCIFLHLLIQHGDIVRNPGPQSSKSKNLLCFDCNVNSLVARNLSEISQFEVCNNSPYKHDFICLWNILWVINFRMRYKFPTSYKIIRIIQLHYPTLFLL